MCRTLNEDLDVDPQSFKYQRPGFSDEVGKVVKALNSMIGSTKTQITRRRVNVKFGDEKIPASLLPWELIETAHENFTAWHKKHASIFKMDSSFDKRVVV